MKDEEVRPDAELEDGKDRVIACVLSDDMKGIEIGITDGDAFLDVGLGEDEMELLIEAVQDRLQIIREFRKLNRKQRRILIQRLRAHGYFGLRLRVLRPDTVAGVH